MVSSAHLDGAPKNANSLRTRTTSSFYLLLKKSDVDFELTNTSWYTTMDALAKRTIWLPVSDGRYTVKVENVDASHDVASIFCSQNYPVKYLLGPFQVQYK